MSYNKGTNAYVINFLLTIKYASYFFIFLQPAIFFLPLIFKGKMIIGWEYELSSNLNHFCVEDEITFSRDSSVLHFSTKHYSPQADTHTLK